MPVLYDELEAWGADVEGAVARFCDNDDLYVSCLRQHTSEEGYAELTEAVASEDAERIFSVAHMLKGVSGNLGLTPIYRAASELSDLVRDGSCAGRMDAVRASAEAMETGFERFRAIVAGEGVDR